MRKLNKTRRKLRMTLRREMAKATQKFEQKLTGVTLELTVKEAQHIRALLGKVTGDTLYPVYVELYKIFEGVDGKRFDVLGASREPVSTLTVKERS